MTDPSIYDAGYFDDMREAAPARAHGGGTLYDDFLALARDAELAGARVLDAGCGRGELAVMLQQAGAKEVTGLDFSSEAILRAAQRARAILGPDHAVALVCASLEARETFAPESFDLVLMTDVVEHLPPSTLAAALRNVEAWLVPGGRLIVHTFPTIWLHRLYNGAMRVSGRRDVVELSNKIHCNVQSRERLAASLRTAGLTCERMWLRNDLLKTSSVYQRLPPGLLRRTARTLAHDLPRLAPVRLLFRGLGLEELVAPSIYAVCRKPA